MKFKESDLRHSADVLREFGNISSPTVFFVLERALRDAENRACQEIAENIKTRLASFFYSGA